MQVKMSILIFHKETTTDLVSYTTAIPVDITIPFSLNSTGPLEHIFKSEVTVTGLNLECW